MFSSEIVLATIDAGVRLGKKSLEILVDKTVEGPLLLPVGDITNVKENQAVKFFSKKANRHLVQKGGPYHGLKPKDLIKPYLTINHLTHDLGKEAVVIVQNLHKYEQYKKGFGSNSVFQRLLGTVVEIGIDYFSANPNSVIKNSKARAIVEAFVTGLEKTDFSEGGLNDIATDVLQSSLNIFDKNINNVVDDKRLQLLLGGITGALIEDISGKGLTLSAKDERKKVYKRITESLLLGATNSFLSNPDLFIKGDKPSRIIFRSVIVDVLKGIENKEDIFSNETLEIIIESSLNVVSENVKLISDNHIIQSFISTSVNNLTTKDSGKLFSTSSIGPIITAGLDIIGENLETLIVADGNGKKELLSLALESVIAGLSINLQSGIRMNNLFSTNQLIDTMQLIFEEVSKTPEHLIGSIDNDPKKTALAQIISSVASGLGTNPAVLINGDGLMNLLINVMHIAVNNIDNLLDLDKEDPKTNLLAKLLKDITEAVTKTEDPRKLFTRKVFLETSIGIIAIASKNIDQVVGTDKEYIKDSIRISLSLANKALSGQINGDNISEVIHFVLTKYLKEEIKIKDDDILLNTVKEFLIAA